MIVKKIIFTDEPVKGQITDSISENLTDSDLESIYIILFPTWLNYRLYLCEIMFVIHGIFFWRFGRYDRLQKGTSVWYASVNILQKNA